MCELTTYRWFMVKRWNDLVAACQEAGARGRPQDGSTDMLVHVNQHGWVVHTFDCKDEQKAERITEIVDEMLTLTSPPKNVWWAFVASDYYLTLVLAPIDAAILKLKMG